MIFRDAGGHTDWCARGHRCNLGEHRSDPITLTLPGTGGGVLVRVRTTTGTDYADLRLSIRLAPAEGAARRQLAGLLADVRTLLQRAAARTPVTGRAAVRTRTPITGRAAP